MRRPLKALRVSDGVGVEQVLGNSKVRIIILVPSRQGFAPIVEEENSIRQEFGVTIRKHRVGFAAVPFSRRLFTACLYRAANPVVPAQEHIRPLRDRVSGAHEAIGEGDHVRRRNHLRLSGRDEAAVLQCTK